MEQIIKFILFIVVIGFLFIVNSHNIQAQQLDSKGSNEIPLWIQIGIPIATAIGGGILTHFISPWIKEKYKLREVYLVPYKEWCSDMYGEVEEFQTLCNCRNILSDDYIVFHFWEIHNTIRHGHKWMGKISKDPLRWRILLWLGIVKTKKENTNVTTHKTDNDKKENTNVTTHKTDNDKKENTNVTTHRWWKCKWLEEKYSKRTKHVQLLKDFIDFTDKKWHTLENNYFGLVNPILSEEAFRMELSKLGKYNMSQMSNDIKKYLQKYIEEMAYNYKKKYDMKKDTEWKDVIVGLLAKEIP